MKLSFGLNGSQVECTVGHSLLIAAAAHIKSGRKTAFEDSLDTIAAKGFSETTKELVLNLLESSIREQMPTNQEVSEWLRTLDGKRFALIHGTLKQPKPITPDTVESVFDEMGEKGFEDLSNAIEEICVGTEMARVNREYAKTLLDSSRMEVSEMSRKLQEKYEEKAAREKPKTREPVQQEAAKEAEQSVAVQGSKTPF